ncbi:MAG TPA: hypothetical protein VMX79_04680 [bacterium]|nr:hypothetical protein [bacterium]
MRKGIIVILCSSLAAGAALAGMGSLINSFPNRGRSTHYGMAADANYLYSYHYDATTDYPINILRRADGSFVRSIAVPFPYLENRYVRGLCFEGGGFLRVNNYNNRYVARLRASNGSLLSTWTWSGGSSRYGLCINGDKENYGTANRIYQSYLTGLWWVSNTNGSLISSFQAPHTNYAYDLAWDYTHDLIWYGNYATGWVMGMTPAGSVMESWRVESTVSYPFGIAYHAGRLYVSTSGGSPDEYIWVYECTYTDAEPASLGRVKAIFE